MLQWSRRPWLQQGDSIVHMTSAGARDYNRGRLCPQRGPDAGFRVRAPGQGVRGAKPLNLLFASRTTLLSVCVCVIYNCERSERKIVLPIDFSCFLCHLRESFLEEGDGRIAPWNPESSSMYKFSLFINVE